MIVNIIALISKIDLYPFDKMDRLLLFKHEKCIFVN